MCLAHRSLAHLSLLSGFTAVVSRPPPVASFSLCDLRLFVIKRIYLITFGGPKVAGMQIRFTVTASLGRLNSADGCVPQQSRLPGNLRKACVARPRGHAVVVLPTATSLA